VWIVACAETKLSQGFLRRRWRRRSATTPAIRSARRDAKALRDAHTSVRVSAPPRGQRDARRVARGARPRGAIDAKYPLGASPEEASLEEFLEPRASAFFFARRFFRRRDNDRRLTSSSLFSLRANATTERRP
jgi:hypothetical protein